MTVTTIHFVRHGEVDNPGHVLYERLPGFPLSARGARMARATARYLASDPRTRGISAVYSSPLERTRQTAGEILKSLNARRAADGEGQLSLVVDERVIEAGNDFRGTRIGHGSGALWRPRNLRLVRNLWKPTWGESYRQIASRMADFSRDIVGKHPGEQVAVVSHESPIWSFRHLLETGHPEHNMLLRHTALASVTSITFDVGTGKVLGISYADPAADVR
ncbi:histidine phosphatase family protein [uncultured Bifidobacterium sp.]|uniref:histidine phosphatase family protein n=1 Tax=uncultured Bifidobacterium sp. TaxID=165187 RepID=UPI0026307824|nr:histidine phosphatase family protein [uncultured Bifidobacterium sp.]